MMILTSCAAMQAQALEWRAQGLRVGLVPTMGFLHEGHLSLMRLARPDCDRLVVSIYVNPLQFGPEEDLDLYPRDLQGDQEKTRSAGADCVFIPQDFYPPEMSCAVQEREVSAGLCGADRPGHFDGVTTVVARLFGLVQPSLAVFGEKDFQQLQVIRRMVRDLAMPVEILGGPLIRDRDGLALSSRNSYLSPSERQRALSLSRALQAMDSSPLSEAKALRTLALSCLDVDALDYLELIDEESCAPVARRSGRVRALIAARIGGTRLIDNLSLSPRPDPSSPPPPSSSSSHAG